MSTDPFAATGRVDEPYPDTAVLAAAVATFFFPVVSLIAALLLMSGQASERKRAQLRNWAWASVAWIVIQVVIFVVLAASMMSTADDFGPPGY